jgi:hypothetical protein
MDFYLTASPSPFPCIEITWLEYNLLETFCVQLASQCGRQFPWATWQ